MEDPKFGPSFQGGKTVRPNKPAQQMQRARGFIVGCANRVTLISWEAGHTPNSKLGKLFIDKNHSISILHTGYNWLHVCKAILLVQMVRTFVQT